MSMHSAIDYQLVSFKFGHCSIVTAPIIVIKVRLKERTILTTGNIHWQASGYCWQCQVGKLLDTSQDKQNVHMNVP